MQIGTNRALHSSLPTGCLIDNASGQRKDVQIVGALLALFDDHIQFERTPGVISEARTLVDEGEGAWAAEQGFLGEDLSDALNDLIADLTDLLGRASGLLVFWEDGDLFAEHHDDA